MRIILDTNILIAAFATQGLCHALLELCLDRFEIILSEEILKETSHNLHQKIKLPEPQCQLISQFLKMHGTVAAVDDVDASACRDQSDLPVLGLASHTGADFIITGDQDLLELGSYKDTQIVMPRTFWTLIKDKG
jgi:uncharacterized protein